MKTIEINGVQTEAYSLIMRKENALEILNGKKNVEIRSLSSKYEKMFTDFEQLKENEALRKQGRDNECKPILRTDIGAVHFYSTGAPWTLDVEIDEIGIGEVTPEGIAFLQDEFGFHGLDYALEDVKNNPKEEPDLFYYLHISGIIGQTGLA